MHMIILAIVFRQLLMWTLRVVHPFVTSVCGQRIMHLGVCALGSYFLLQDGCILGAVVLIFSTKYGINLIREGRILLLLLLEYCIDVVPVTCEFWCLQIQIYICVMCNDNSSLIDAVAADIERLIYRIFPLCCPRAIYCMIFCHVIENETAQHKSSSGMSGGCADGNCLKARCSTGMCGGCTGVDSKKTKKNRSSVGAFKPAPDLRTKRKRNEHDVTNCIIEEQRVPMSDDDVIGVFVELKKCGCKLCGNRYGGNLTTGPEGIAAAMVTVRECRAQLSGHFDLDYDRAFSQLFRSTITKTDKDDKGNVSKLYHEWKVPVGGEDIKVCRSTWARLHGVSEYSLDNESRIYRGAPKAISAQLTSYTDSYIADYSFDELETIITDNLPDESEGATTYVDTFCVDDFYAFIVEEWVQCALTPMSDRRQIAVFWMGEFFKLCDQSPSSEFIRVNEDTKKEVFVRYQAETKELHPDTELLDYDAFCKLWLRIFPYCVKRVHCAIPGKCWVCAEIDRLRRCAEDRLTRLRLKEAHMLHRGGMFMQERKRYVAQVSISLSCLILGL
jgi:hypothetical protein